MTVREVLTKLLYDLRDIEEPEDVSDSENNLYYSGGVERKNVELLERWLKMPPMEPARKPQTQPVKLTKTD